MIKRILLPLAALALLIPALAAADGPVLLVELPEEALVIEDVQFEDGDFIQTYQLDGATVQLLRYAAFDMTLAELAEADWTGYVPGEALAIEAVGGYPAEGMRLRYGEGSEAVDVALVLVHADGQTLIFQAVTNAGADGAQVQAMLDSLGVLGGEAGEEAEAG